MSAVTEPWTCPTCNDRIATPYCPACGEGPPHPRELTLRGLFGQIVQALTNVDGRLIRSFRCLVNHPGALTVAYLQGQRKPYIGPFQLFLIANVFFFAAQSLTDSNVFSSPLSSHLHQQDWSAIAQELVSQRLEKSQTSLDVYAPIFNQAVVLNAKTLVFLMVLPFALLLPIVFHRTRRPFVAHAVFALHLYTFLLLLFCVALAIAGVHVAFGGAGLQSARLDNILSVFNLAVCAVYLYVAAGTVYGATGVIRVIKVVGLAGAVACIVLGYRFALFLITLYTT